MSAWQAARLVPAPQPHSQLILTPSSEVFTTQPPPAPFLDSAPDAFLCLGFLLLASVFSMLRGALEFSHPVRVTEDLPEGPARARLASLLENVQPLTTSASLMMLTFRVCFVISLLWTLEVQANASFGELALATGVAVLSLVLASEVIPSVLARRFGDGLLRKFLPAFQVILFPVALAAPVIDGVRRGMRRVVGLPEDPSPTRTIVEDLREVIVDTAKTGGLDENERELIENVMEFRDVDVAAVMTPRTEISGVEVEKGLTAVVQKAAETNHSRIPVYQETVDNIIGTVSVRDLVKYAATDDLDAADLRERLRPAYFVPETMPVSQLLTEFRRERLKLAIVLDEYGGTAGLVTLGDVIEEIVGDLHEEFEEAEQSPLRRVAEGITEIDASLHVSEVNEELDLDLPEEEDFETLAGFMLAEFGRMPRQEDHFFRDGVKFIVTEASDRRVLLVRVEQTLRKPA